jgi:taurine--2-oxoglutarate transaminase
VTSPFFFTWSAQGRARPLEIRGGSGAWFTTADGGRWLDLASLSYQAALGHGHPRMIEAITRQAREMCLAPPNADFPAKREVAEELLRLAGPGFAGGRVFFTLGGAEANENAMKIAKLATGRWKFISRYRSYHGASMGAVSLTGDFRRPPVEPGLPGVIHLVDDDADHVRQVLEHEGPGSVAAIFLEPVPGANGVHLPPAGFWPEVRRLCDEHGTLLVADEVLTGFGRTGTCFGVEWLGVVPDMITVSKALTAGYAPLGAVIVSPRLARHFDDHVLWAGLTFYAHPLGCAAAREALAIYREEDLYCRGQALERVLAAALGGLAARHHEVSAVRWKGALACLDLRLSPAGWSVLGDELERRRLLVHESARRGTIVVSPPLIIDEGELGAGLGELGAAIDAAIAAAPTG